jgi:signal transduction histidine kinase
MAGPKVYRKWRPTLGLVVFSVLLAVLALPAASVIWFRAMDDTTSRMGPVEGAALVVALLLTLAIAYVLTRTITRPINALIARTIEIGKGGLSAIVPLESYGTREIATLSQSFLDLAARLVERTEYVHSFAAHVSHELKSPLTSIKGAAELLRDDDAGNPMTPDERRRFLDHIIADSERMDRLLGRLRELAKAELETTVGQTTLAAIIAELELRHPKLEFAITGALDLPIGLSLEAGTIILGHLADNAQQHGATRLTITAGSEDAVLGIIVADDGTGISPGNRALVFQPFFSTRRDSGGTGMGLDIARAMLQAHGGSIRLLESEHGASFEILVPMSA